MSSIDERVVEMKFNNSDFDRNISSTVKSLDTLKNSLKLDAAAKGLNDVDAAGKRLSLGKIAEGVESISSKFSALSIIGITALTNIANKAINVGSTLVKSLTIDPIKTGLQEYETQMNAVQTILANTASKGTNLKQVNSALNELNTYADKTIYNFTEMTKNVGTFTAAGVDLKTSVEAIKGISNLAAVSGSNAQQAATAQYQLSQAIASGTVKLMDWNSVVNAGMGGQVFQDALKSTAKVHGVNVDAMIKKEGSFRETLQSGWLTSKILTETLSKFTGDLSEKQLLSMGYTEAQAAEIIKLGQTANDAATKVKTMSQLMDTLKEAVQSGWAQTWQILFGDFEEAKQLFTSMSDTFGPIIQESADARNNLLKGWKDLGGRTVLIETIGTAFKNLMSIITNVASAFKEVFPPITAQQLLSMTLALRNFVENLKMGDSDLAKFKNTVKGVFSIFSIAWQVISRVGQMIFELVGFAAKGSSGILDFTSNIGLWLVGLDQAIKKGDDLNKFFAGLTNLLKQPIIFIQNLGTQLSALGNNVSKIDLSPMLAGISRFFDPFTNLVTAGSITWDAFVKALSGVWDSFSPMASKIAAGFSWLADKVKTAMGYITLDNMVKAGQIGGIGLLATIGISIKKFIDGLTGSAKNFGGIGTSIKDVLGAMTDRLTAMQQNVKANTLLQISVAIALLAASAVALSTVDTGKLVPALAAMTLMLKGLMGTLTGLSTVAGSTAVAKLPVITASLVLLAIAVNLLTTAVKKLSELSWEQLAKGLIGVGGLLASLTLFTKFSEADKGAMSKGLGIILLATGLNILALAMKQFASMSWGDLAKGGAAVAGSLLAISLTMKLMPKNIPAIGAGLLAVSTALLILSGAFKVFASMSWEELGKGGAALAGSLLAIAGAMKLMPKDLLLKAPALIALGIALNIIGLAIITMGSMGWEQIGKGLATLAGSLLIISGAMALMSGALPGAAALVIVAGALTILTPVLLTLGNMSLEQIGIGLLALAGAFAVIGIAGLALGPVVPALLGLGAAVALLGIGMAAAGIGLTAFAAGLTALSISGAAGAAALVAIVTSLIGLIPMIIEQVAKGLVRLLVVISESGAEITAAASTLILAICDAINNTAPTLIDTLVGLVVKMADTLATNVPKLVSSGLKLINGVLKGIRDNIRETATVALEIVSEFIRGISDGLPQVADSAAKLIISFVNSISSAIDNNSEAMGRAGGRLAAAIVTGMVKGIAAGVDEVVMAAKNLAERALDAAKKSLGIASPSKKFEEIGQNVTAGFVKGIRGAIPWAQVVKSQIAQAFDTMTDELNGFLSDSANSIKESQAKLKALQKKPKRNKKAIAAEKATLAGYQKEYNAARAAQDQLIQERKIKEAELEKISKAYEDTTASIKDAEAYLDKRNSYADSVKAQYSALPSFTESKAYTNALSIVGKKYEDITAKVNNAETALHDATKAMADSSKSIKDQYSALSSFDKETTFSDYTKNLEKRIEDTKKLRDDLSTLRSIGLDDTMYKDLLAKGVDALPFVQNLVAAGPEGIQQLKDLYSELGSEAGYLGATVSQEFYSAGVDSAKSILAGLKNQQSGVSKEISDISGNYLSGFESDLQTQIDSNKKLAGQLAELRKMGLSDRAYSELVSKGASAQPFIDDLLKNGKSGVDKVNQLIINLDSSASALANQAADKLYKVGDQTAQGFLDGLKARQKDLEAQMIKMGDSIVNAIKSKLGIASPSKEFAKIGKFSAVGLVKGIKDNTGLVVKSAKDLGSSTIDILKKSISNISEALSNEVDMDPTIRPILDLSMVKKDALKIDSIISPGNIRPKYSYDRANGISVESDASKNQIMNDNTQPPKSGDTITFNQTNTSPKALSNAEIYRQTKNQLATVRKGLSL